MDQPSLLPEVSEKTEITPHHQNQPGMEKVGGLRALTFSLGHIESDLHSLHFSPCPELFPAGTLSPKQHGLQEYFTPTHFILHLVIKKRR